MDRREALKISGKGAGIAFLTPGILALLQSCSEEKRPVDWQPSVLTDRQALQLTLLADVIVPPTSSPSASQTDTLFFIDRLMLDVLQEDQVGQIVKILDQIDSLCKEMLNVSFSRATPEQRYEFLSKVDDQAFSLVGEKTYPSDLLEAYRYLKSLVLIGYYSSEEGRKQNLEYLPTPGQYEGCVELSADKTIIVGDHL